LNGVVLEGDNEVVEVCITLFDLNLLRSREEWGKKERKKKFQGIPVR